MVIIINYKKKILNERPSLERDYKTETPKMICEDVNIGRVGEGYLIQTSHLVL